jgi:ferredoxin-type protein NapH
MRLRRISLRYIRWASKLAFLILFIIPLQYVPNGPVWPAPYTGVTTISNFAIRPTQPFFYVPMVESPCSIWFQGWSNPTLGAWLVEPLGAVQALITTKVDISLLMDTIIALCIVLIIIILVGSMFCSWACPIGTLVDSFDSFVGRFLPKVEAKRAKIIDKNLQVALHEVEANKTNPTICLSCPITRLVTKNGVATTAILAGSIGAASVLGFNAFCLICPIGISTRGLFHLKATTFSTKAVTGQWIINPFFLELLVFPVIALLVSLKERRFWCNKLCPVGAIINLTASLNPFIKPKLHPERCIMNGCPRDCKDNLIGYCSACRKEDNFKCQRICPPQINLVGSGSLNRCTKCMECYITCDHGAIEIRPYAKPDIFRIRGFFSKLIANRKKKQPQKPETDYILPAD